MKLNEVVSFPSLYRTTPSTHDEYDQYTDDLISEFEKRSEPTVKFRPVPKEYFATVTVDTVQPSVKDVYGQRNGGVYYIDGNQPDQVIVTTLSVVQVTDNLDEIFDQDQQSDEELNPEDDISDLDDFDTPIQKQ